MASPRLSVPVKACLMLVTVLAHSCVACGVASTPPCEFGADAETHGLLPMRCRDEDILVPIVALTFQVRCITLGVLAAAS